MAPGDREILRIGEPGYFIPWMAEVDRALDPDALRTVIFNENSAYPDRLGAYWRLQQLTSMDSIRPAFAHLLSSETPELRHFCYLCLSARKNEFAKELLFGNPSFRDFLLARCRQETHPALRWRALDARIGLQDDTIEEEIDQAVDEITRREISRYARLKERISQLKQSGDWQNFEGN